MLICPVNMLNACAHIHIAKKYQKPLLADNLIKYKKKHSEKQRLVNSRFDLLKHFAVIFRLYFKVIVKPEKSDVYLKFIRWQNIKQIKRKKRRSNIEFTDYGSTMLSMKETRTFFNFSGWTMTLK